MVRTLPGRSQRHWTGEGGAHRGALSRRTSRTLPRPGGPGLARGLGNATALEALDSPSPPFPGPTRAGPATAFQGASCEVGGGLWGADRLPGTRRGPQEPKPCAPALLGATFSRLLGPAWASAAEGQRTRVQAAGRCPSFHLWCGGAGTAHRHPCGMVTFACPVGRWASPWAICFLLWLRVKGDAHQQVVGSASVEMQGDGRASC